MQVKPARQRQDDRQVCGMVNTPRVPTKTAQLACRRVLSAHLVRLVAHKDVSLQSEAELSSTGEAAVCCCVAAV
jgi:hypothetical protein